MEKVSIIIPVYNVEDYLSQCLDSVINQTYKNIEIILIDDGSSDLSGKICDEYARKDKRIAVYHNTNHGVSYSRNYGIKVSIGEYILFVDSDDYIERNYVETLMEPIFLQNYDLIICSAWDVFGENKIPKAINFNLTGVFKEDYQYVLRTVAPWGKLYVSEIIKKNKILFPEDISYGEDHLFNLQYFEYVDKYKFVFEHLYNYCHRNQQGLSRQRTQKSFQSVLRILEVQKKFLFSHNIKNSLTILSDNLVTIINDFIVIKDETNDYACFVNRIKTLKQIFPGNYVATNFKRYLVLKCISFNFLFPIYVYYKIKHYKK